MANTRNKRKGEDSVLKVEPTDEAQVPAKATLQMSSKATSSKKRKLDEHKDNSTSTKKSTLPYSKHETHWNLDGSVLLQIGKTRFKTHRSRLVAESEFFRALIDQHNGVFDAEPCSRQEEVDHILAAIEDVDGLDLFFLDAEEVEGAPNADEFAVLLTAMNKGINFAYERPTQGEVVALLKASAFYEMETYTIFCQRYILDLFPDSWPKIPVKPCIASAVEGLSLNTLYPDLLGDIRVQVFYDLARSPLYLDPEMDDNGEFIRGPAKSQERKALKSLRAADLVTLLDLQKRLKGAWDGIIESMTYTCKTQTCNKVHTRGSTHAMSIAKEFPYDPIIGVRKILEHMPFLTFYCLSAANYIKFTLKIGVGILWTDFDNWVRLNDEDSDDD